MTARSASSSRKHPLAAVVALLAAAAAPGQSDACFVPNLGQWSHPARFVHRSGGMTVFLQERGWTLDLVEPIAIEPVERERTGPLPPPQARLVRAEAPARGVAIRMTFEGGDSPLPRGEHVMPGRHHYFLGADAGRWRTDVPLYEAVRYASLYRGVDLRFREHGGVPEYDLLLEPGADLAGVSVRVEGAEGLSIDEDGALVIETGLGPLTQPRPRTWAVEGGRERPVACAFVLLGPDRFGFAAPEWDGATELVIDPGLIWSTYLGGPGSAFGVFRGLEAMSALHVDDRGIVTAAGHAFSPSFPTTPGAYSTTMKSTNATKDTVVSRLDPRASGAAQLLYSTYVGGSYDDFTTTIAVDSDGVVTFAGVTGSPDFPITANAYASRHSGGSFWYEDGFVCRLDPRQTGAAQLVYSTFLGGGGDEWLAAMVAGADGVLTLAGATESRNFPTTNGAYDATFNGGRNFPQDAFVCRLDPSLSGRSQLLYSTFFGASGDWDRAFALAVDAAGVVTIAGDTASANLPTTPNAFDRTYDNRSPVTVSDGFVCRLDPRASGSAQLVYATYLGGIDSDVVWALAADDRGLITLTGLTESHGFPTTTGAFDTTHGQYGDGFVARLDPSATGAAQLVYGAFLGADPFDQGLAIALDSEGVITVAGETYSPAFPTTPGAVDTTHNGQNDGFVARIDPRRSGAAQLVHSTFLGSPGLDVASAVFLDGSRTAYVAGAAGANGFPTTPGAYASTFAGSITDTFLARLALDNTMYADVHAISLGAGGAQAFTIDAGAAHAGRAYWVLGSLSGTSPGFALGGVHVPLQGDGWTQTTLDLANSALLVGTAGVLDAAGTASAALVLPPGLPPVLAGLTFHHACVVFDRGGPFRLVSNPVRLGLVR